MGSDCCKPSKEDLDDSQIRNNHVIDSGHSRHPRESALDVEILVRDALSVIRTLVDQDQEPPLFLAQLASIADRDWVLVVSSLCRAVPLEDAIGPAVISLVLDDCPLPCKEALMGFVDLLDSAPSGNVAYERNLCVAMACVADKLAGPSAVALLNKTTLTFLTDRLDYRKCPTTQVILFALLALEKFAQTSENKVTIQKFMAERSKECESSNEEGDGECHPLEVLEAWADETDLIRRQVGFCAQWALDNVFVLPGREYSYLKVDMRGINAMLNGNDSSEYLKIAPNGLEARGDATSFESVRSTFEVSKGCWYYEVHLVTEGIMQIGWATRDSKFFNHEGFGIGDDQYSIAYDGCRQLVWHNAQSTTISHNPWKANDILGCLLDIDRKECIFSLNGSPLPASICSSIFNLTKESGFFAAASFMTYQQCRFNFGLTDFVHPPKDREFKNFNSYGELTPELAMIIPRHVKLKRSSIGGVNVCSLCVDLEATMQLHPCGHSGFCEKCAFMLENCPLCRTDILERRTVTPSAAETPSSGPDPTATLQTS